MTDSPSNIAEFTVSEIAFAVKRTVEDAFGQVRVRGEISGFRGPHSSGHCYFTLKDEKARLESVIWRGVYNRLKVKPEEGLEVIATGKLTTYPGSSKYQIVIERLEPAGIGALMALLEERRRKLAAEGLFDEARKQKIPFLPRTIGVVTSPTGAVIRDILHRLNDRFAVRTLVWPVRVQGETSAAEVATAIRGFNSMADDGSAPRPDLIIVARGGGSLEDLWGFNEEAVVRAAAESQIPLISAVGHETDWTLIDHAADLRAPTPTAAAELAVPVRSDLLATVDDLVRRHRAGMQRGFETKRAAMRSAERGLPRLRDLLNFPRQRFDDLAIRLPQALRAATTGHRARFDRAAVRLSTPNLARGLNLSRQKLDALADRQDRAAAVSMAQYRQALNSRTGRLRPALLTPGLRQGANRVDQAGQALVRQMAGQLDKAATRFRSAEKLLGTLSYRSVLGRGFALVRDDAGTPIRSAASVGSGNRLDIEFQDGHVDAVAGRAKTEKPATPPRPKPARGGAKSDDSQGRLF